MPPNLTTQITLDARTHAQAEQLFSSHIQCYCLLKPLQIYGACLPQAEQAGYLPLTHLQEDSLQHEQQELSEP